MNREVAVYKGDELLAMGSIREVAKILNVQARTIYWYMMPTYQRRIAKRKKTSGNYRVVVAI